ncbi:MAG: hypothetical protein KAI18_00045 [Candidatus Aenigmarchaeota archaeon]|nr:hypothetical protein [Candidatus Aenigmarchaeota archaeon]
MNFIFNRYKQNRIFKRKGFVQHWFVLIMSFLLVIAIIILVTIFNINVTSTVVTGNLNMQYSTDAGREIYALLSAGCPAVGDPYTDYSVSELISVYVSGDLTVKESIDTDLRDCIASSLATIAEVNEGVDKTGDPIPHYMYFYVTYGNNKYIESRQPSMVYDPGLHTLMPWNSEFISTTTGLDFNTTILGGKTPASLPVDPRYFSSTMNDRYSIQIPLSDSGNMQHSSATAVLEEWSDESWTTLTQAQQEESA